MVGFWKYIWEAVDGLKTLGISALIFLLGLADYFDAVNVRPVLDSVLGEDKAAKIMLFLPLIFATLRFFTNDRPKWMRRRDDSDESTDCTKERN